MDLKTLATVYNPLDTDFTHAWDGQPFTIKAGKTETHPVFLAHHLAKHLADEILRREGKFEDEEKDGKKKAQVVSITDKHEVMKRLIDRGLSEEQKEEKQKAEEEAAVIGKTVEEPVNQPKKKAKKAKKEEPEAKQEPVLDDLSLDELKALAKEKGIKSWHLKGKDKLLAELNG